MPTSEETRQQVQGLRIVQGVFQAAALAALIALGGGGKTVSTGKGVGGTGASVTIYTGVDLKASREIREIVLLAYNKCADRVTNLMMAEGTKVPIDTGLLRRTFHFYPEPDASAFHLTWPIFYAQYLWEMDPGATGKEGRVKGTLKNWSKWAIDVVTPIVLDSLREAFEEYGYTVQVS
jgi:hypothetical protein